MTTPVQGAPMPAAGYPADLGIAVDNFEQAATEAAAESVKDIDPVFGAIASDVPDTCASVMAEFKAHLAAIEAQYHVPNPRPGQQKPPAYHERRQAVLEARKKVMDSSLKIWRDKLTQLEASAKGILQSGFERSKPRPQDIADVNALGQRLGMLSARHGLPVIAEAVREAAINGNSRSAVAMLPLLRSLYDEGHGDWRGHGDLAQLIGMAEKLTSTAHTKVAQVRLERVRRFRYDLEQYVGGVLTGSAVTPQAMQAFDRVTLA